MFPCRDSPHVRLIDGFGEQSSEVCRHEAVQIHIIGLVRPDLAPIIHG